MTARSMINIINDGKTVIDGKSGVELATRLFATVAFVEFIVALGPCPW
jgi:hypothetical protein